MGSPNPWEEAYSNMIKADEEHPNTSMGSMGSGLHAPLPYEKVDHPKHYNEHPAGIECI